MDERAALAIKAVRQRAAAGLWAGLLCLAAAPSFVVPGVARAQAAADKPADHAADRPTGQATEKTIPRQQAKDLLASVDQIMDFAAADSGLPAVDKVKRRLVTRDEVGRYLLKNFDDDDSARRLQRSEIVLKKFGMLDRDFNLRPFLLSLLTEQIAGYYDDKTKTVNLLNWVDPEEQKPVLAHELTHALQDQQVGLEHWSSGGFKGISTATPEDNRRVAADELETARQAVAEGQAMVVFVDYTLKASGKTLADSPEVADRIRDAAADPSGSPIMSRAPLLLQRSLMFPYSNGLSFEQAMLAAGGKSRAFAAVLAAPPSTSFEIMNPQAYLRHVPMPVLRLPDVHPLLDPEYAPYEVGAMGELDVEMMAGLFGGPQLASALAPAWAGGIYYAAQRRSATDAEKRTTASLALFYYSRWSAPEAAHGFAQLYQAELGRKYARVAERRGDEAEGETVFTTSEGDVLLWQSGRDLFIAEGYPLATARKLREATLAVQGTGPLRMASQPELTLGTARLLSTFGLVKAALR